VGLTYREARTVECGNCRPRTRRGEEEVGIDDYHMLPSLPISRTSITIITFPISFFLFSFLSTRPLSPTSLFPFWAGWWCAQLVPGNSHSTGIFHAAERSMPWLAIFSHAGGGGEEREGLWCGWNERYVECSNGLIDSSGGFRFVAMPGIQGGGRRITGWGRKGRTIVWEK